MVGSLFMLLILLILPRSNDGSLSNDEEFDGESNIISDFPRGFCFTRIKPFFTLRDCPCFLKKPLGRRFENTGDNGSVLA